MYQCCSASMSQCLDVSMPKRHWCIRALMHPCINASRYPCMTWKEEKGTKYEDEGSGKSYLIQPWSHVPLFTFVCLCLLSLWVYNITIIYLLHQWLFPFEIFGSGTFAWASQLKIVYMSMRTVDSRLTCDWWHERCPYESKYKFSSAHKHRASRKRQTLIF